MADAAMAELKLADGAPQPPVARERKRRPTKENIPGNNGFVSLQHMLSGTDHHGIRIRLFTAGQQRQQARICGVSEYKYEGDTIPSEEEGLRLPGKQRHGQRCALVSRSRTAVG